MRHNLVERGVAAIAQSKTKVETAIRDPSSQDAKRILGAGVASFVLGLQLGGPYLGLFLAFASTRVDFQHGLAGDISNAVEEVTLLAWKRSKELSRRFFS